MDIKLDKLKEVVRAFNVPSLELNGYEADDIMGTLARKAERQGIITFLVTGDKDFMQLLSPNIKIFKPGKRGDEWEIVDEKGVMEKFGVKPNHVIDVLGLTGDKSDNVPGVLGVGEKTAIPLVRQYGTIENIYDNIDKILQKGLQHKLKENRENAFLSKILVTIDVNVPIDIDIHHLIAKPHDKEKLTKLFLELEFQNLIRKLSQEKAPLANTIESSTAKMELADIITDEHRYNLITSDKGFKALANNLAHCAHFVFDTETTSTDPLQAELVGLSFAMKAGEAWYVPVISNHDPSAENDDCEIFNSHQTDLFSSQNSNTQIRNTEDNSYLIKPGNRNPIGFSLNAIKKNLSAIFSDSTVKKIGQNIKYDALVLNSLGIHINGIMFDTMVANYILRPDGQHNLDAMAKEHLNYKMISFDDLTGTGKDRKDIRDIPAEKVAEYSNQDADITYRLYELLHTKLESQHLASLCEEVEFPLIAVLSEMELNGVKLDINFLGDLSKELEQLLDKLIGDIYGMTDEKFNINSTQQLSNILFEKLKLSVGRKTKTGYSTDVGVLETLRHEHPIIEKLLEYRQLQKLKTTYVDALPMLINPRTGKVHTSFNQTITSTGRLSSSNPNFQNIPIRTEMGSQIRRAFIPSGKNMLIVSADYSQIELRIMAHISGDEGLRAAFKNGEDIHSTTAAKVFGVKSDEVTKDMRRKAKEVNFGIMYGIGAFGLAARLDISQIEAKGIITKYFERFPKVNQYIFDTIAKTKRDGYVSTLLGRRRYLPDINSRNQNIRSNAERQAINMPIQGTAADMIKLAMIKIHDKLKDDKINAKMLLQVHDELVFEFSKHEEQQTLRIITHEMKNALPLSVPVEVDIGTGLNWLEAH